MKVTVNYGKKNYGNRENSKATKVIVNTSRKHTRIKIEFLKAQYGRSWDWLSAGSVGGAEIEIGTEDALALAQLLLDVVEAKSKVDEEFDAMDLDRPCPYGVLKLLEDTAPDSEVRDREVDGYY